MSSEICPGVNNIVIHGKRWFDAINGNTYHSVEVYADGKFVGSNPFEYGYDDAYIQTAFEVLQKAGVCQKTDKRLKSGVNEDWYRFMQDKRENRDKYLTFVADVSRKKDLQVRENKQKQWRWID